MVLIALLAIGSLHIEAESGKTVSAEFAVALVSLAYTVVFMVFLWRTAIMLRDSDRRRSTEEHERKVKQAQLTAIIDSAMDGIVTTDEAQRIVLFNPAAERIFGRPAASVLGGSLDVLMPERYWDVHGDHVRNYGATGATSRSMGVGVVTGLRANGEEFPVEASIARQAVDNEHYDTVILRDITERQRSDDCIRRAIAEAERANNAKSRFLAAASHDLRQPLAALGIYVNVLASRGLPADPKMVDSMKECVADLSELLNDLLDLSKLHAGVVVPRMEDMTVANLFYGLESIYLPKAQLKGLHLRCVPSRLSLRTDPVLFRRMLGNLIDNAVKYTERGGIVIGCRRRDGQCWVEVWDSGIGIPGDKTAEIFEEFKQLGDDARNRGSGLGLAIVAKTAALLGLQISIRSWPGHGSVFGIELPLCEVVDVGAATIPGEADFRALRVALVEDNTLVREAVSIALQGLGHQVVVASGGDALLAELADAPPPDIVVSDYRLARGETGFDVIAAMRARLGMELPAIVITGDTDPSLIRSMDVRRVTVLHKPLDMKNLQSYLEDLTAPTFREADGAGAAA